MDVLNSALGKKSAYLNQYTPTLLFPIARQLKRKELGIDEQALPFFGIDIWNHYEVSWLNMKGKPQVAIAVIELPATSPNIIESKSMKLYFNSFNNHKLADKEQLSELIEQDLTVAAKAQVKVKLLNLDSAELQINRPTGLSIDDIDLEITEYQVKPELLSINSDSIVNEVLYSNLLKSNCLVTNQPDWATITIEYTGPQINHTALLEYLISFRDHNEFHEQCVERVFKDILQHCQPNALTVSARFTRRGGLDINPIRSTLPNFITSNYRLIRQ